MRRKILHHSHQPAWFPTVTIPAAPAPKPPPMPHSTADQAFIDALPYSALQDFRDRSFLSTHVHDRAQHFVVDHSWVDIGQLRAFTTKRAIASAVISRASFDASGVDGLPVGFISRYRDTIYRADYIAEFPERFLSTDWIDASHIRKILENTRHFDAPADPLADIQVRDVRDERGRIVPRPTSGSPPQNSPDQLPAHARLHAEGRAQASAAQALDQEIAEAKRLQKEAAGRVKELNAQKSAGKSKGKGRPARVLAGDSSSGRVRSTAARSAALAAPPNTVPFPSMALREQAVPDHAAPILFPLSMPTDESFPDPASFATDDAALDFGFPSSDDFGLNDASFWSDDILAGLGDAMYNEFTAVAAGNFGAVSYPSQGNTGIYLPGLQAPLPPQENLGMYFPGSQLPPPRPSPSPPPMPLASTSYMAGNDADTASAAATRAPTRRSSRKRARAESAPGSVAQKRAAARRGVDIGLGGRGRERAWSTHLGARPCKEVPGGMGAPLCKQIWTLTLIFALV
ncbi:hypothetical protein MKEN_00189300 [Mycena kentingensis (nom. inval.)]|nr:hypothetical protein MKEN_00189300 [Mycena kentingensis (nom. inval.)]